MVADLDNDPLDSCTALHTGHAWFGVGDYAQALSHWTRATEIARRAGLASIEGYALAALATPSPGGRSSVSPVGGRSTSSSNRPPT